VFAFASWRDKSKVFSRVEYKADTRPIKVENAVNFKDTNTCIWYSGAALVKINPE